MSLTGQQLPFAKVCYGAHRAQAPNEQSFDFELDRGRQVKYHVRFIEIKVSVYSFFVIFRALSLLAIHKN